MRCIHEGSFYIGYCEAWGLSLRHDRSLTSNSVTAPISFGKGACVTLLINSVERDACSDTASHSSCQEIRIFSRIRNFTSRSFFEVFYMYYVTKYAFVAIFFKWLVEYTCFVLYMAPLPV